MYKNLTPPDICNSLVMARQLDLRGVLLLEGVNDFGAISPHVNHASVDCKYVGGKDRVLKVIRLVNSVRLDRVLAIVDRDFDGILNPEVSEGNVVYADEADMDAMIFFSGSVLDRILRNHADVESMEADLQRSGQTVEGRFVSLSFPVGVLRKMSMEFGFGLDLDKVPFHSVVGSDGVSVDYVRLCDMAVRKSEKHRAPSDLQERYKKELDSTPISRAFCRGHDLAGALDYCVRLWGGKKVLGRKGAEALVRACFAKSDLVGSAFYRDVAAWGQRHQLQVWA